MQSQVLEQILKNVQEIKSSQHVLSPSQEQPHPIQAERRPSGGINNHMFYSEVA
jgi:hypothetical protein